MATTRDIQQLSVLMNRLGRGARQGLLDYIASGILPKDIGQNTVAAAGVAIIDRMIKAKRRDIVISLGKFRTPGLDRLERDIKVNWVRRCREVPSILLDVTSQIKTPSLSEGWRDARVGRRRLTSAGGINPRELANESIIEAYGDSQGRASGIQKLQNKIENIVEGKMPLRINVAGGPTVMPEYRFYDPSDYAELVGLTTTAEMSQVAYLDQAEAIETTLVKMPYFAKDYAKLKDHVCDRINGKIFSIKPEGSSGASGIWYPYLYSSDGIGDTGYPTPHPRCNHIARPIPEAAA